jgi:two-component system, chemotaxis family, chemotaxis protein CheY
MERPVSVLIVDDSSVMRKVIGRTLLQTGLEITEMLEAENGLDALTLIRARGTEKPALCLILIDVNMPVMNGFEFVEQMRAESLMPKVPVVMITTEASEAQVRRAVAAGAAGYIRKPFTADQLKCCVARLVTTL